jgi:hypothetical protein
MLIKVGYPLGDDLRKPHLAGDIGATMAAGVSQLVADDAGLERRVNDDAEPIEQVLLHSRISDQIAQELRRRMIEELGLALEINVVGHVKLADARRGA